MKITVRGFYLGILVILLSVSAVTLWGIVEMNSVLVLQLGATKTVALLIDILLYGPQIPLYFILFHYYNKNRYRLDVLKH